ERNFTERQGLGESRQGPLDLVLHRFELEPKSLEDRRGDPFSVADQPEQNVLGTDEIVAKAACFFPGQDDDPTRPFRESFEHWFTSLWMKNGLVRVLHKPALSITLLTNAS